MAAYNQIFLVMDPATLGAELNRAASPRRFFGNFLRRGGNAAMCRHHMIVWLDRRYPGTRERYYRCQDGWQRNIDGLQMGGNGINPPVWSRSGQPGARLCGARTKHFGKSCRCLAMSNGRCYWHGGVTVANRDQHRWNKKKARQARVRARQWELLSRDPPRVPMSLSEQRAASSEQHSAASRCGPCTMLSSALKTG
jgi:hypothetical protein